MDKDLLALLVCPNCKGSLKYDQSKPALICEQDKLVYPIKNGIPVMLVEEAEKLEE